MRAIYRYVPAIAMLIILLLGPAAANPAPYMEWDQTGTPKPYSETPLILRSEDLLFIIDNTVTASGNFTIYNPTNETVNQSVAFPFRKSNYLYAEHYGWFNDPILDLSVNGTNLSYSFTTYHLYRAVLFNITVLPFEEITLYIKYKTYWEKEDYWGSFFYVTTTGKEWNQTIKHAYFKFIISNETLKDHLTGVDEDYDNGNHTIATIERFDWEPEDNIQLRWRTPGYYEFFSIPRLDLMPEDAMIYDYYSFDYYSYYCDSPPLLRWRTTFINPDNEVIYYDVYWSDDRDKIRKLDPGARIAMGITNTSFQVESFMGDHYCTVIPRTDTICGTCDRGILRFMGETHYSLKPDLFSPEGNTVVRDDEVTLSWNHTYRWKTLYSVYFGEERALVENTHESVNRSYRQPEKFKNVTGLKDGHVYYWTVEAYDGESINRSELRAFIVRLDSDNDGVRDSEDAYPHDASRWMEDRSIMDSIDTSSAGFRIVIIIILVVVAEILVFVFYKGKNEKGRPDV